MKRSIFLDFDGVMDTTHYTSWLYHDRYGVVFDPESIGHLKEIVDRTCAEIVVSSSWKDTMSYAQILQMWKGRNLPGFVTDVTPTCSNHRGDEIASWLELFKEMSGGEECEYVIIDDLGEADFNDDQIGHLVTVDSFYGLDENGKDKAIAILNGMSEDEDEDEPSSITREDIMEIVDSVKTGLIKARKPMLVLLSVIIVLLGIKWVWASCYLKDTGSFEEEKQDILARRDYLHDKLVTSPDKILATMPAAIGEQCVI